jgi:hypothetical protein
MDRIAKAIVGAATYLAGWVATATQSAADGVGSEITSAELVTGIAGTVAAFFLVWAIPNGGSD